jgi:hypothetical protein
MKGPEGLKVGMVVYATPDLDDITEEMTLADFDTAQFVVAGPRGLCLIDLNHGSFLVLRDDPPFLRYARPEKVKVDEGFYLMPAEVDAETEWFHTQAEAVLASADADERYYLNGLRKVRVARRIAGSE